MSPSDLLARGERYYARMRLAHERIMRIARAGADTARHPLAVTDTRLAMAWTVSRRYLSALEGLAP